MPLTRLASKNRAPTAAETTTISEPTPPARVRGKPRAPATETITVGGGTLARLANKFRTRAETVTISENAARLSSKTRALAAQTTTITGGTLAILRGKVRPLATQTVTIGETVSRLATKSRALATQTVTVSSGTLAILRSKTRPLATQTVTIGENLARLTTKTRALAAQTTTITGGTLTRLAAKIRALATQTITLSESVTGTKTTGQKNITRALTTETTAISESLARLLNKLRPRSDTVTVSGGTVARLATKTRLASDRVVLGEGTYSLYVHIPLYIYPTVWVPGSEWFQLADMMALYPNVQFILKINVNSGPDTALNTDYQSGIATLKAGGNDKHIKILGYVYTSYGSRPIADVKTDIDRWQTFYSSDINGIFLDEMESVTGDEAYYREITNYIHKDKGMEISWGNPGTTVDESYVKNGCVDVFQIAESTDYPTLTTIQNSTFNGTYTPSKFALGIHSVTSYNSTTIASFLPYAAYFFVTGDVMPTPYDTLSTYIDDLAVQSTALPKVVRIKGIVKSLAAETITVTGGTVARLLAKTRTTTQNVVIGENLTRLSQKIRALTTQIITVGAGIATAQKTTGAQNITRALAAETVAISESINRLTAKIRALATQIVTISETPNRSNGKSRALAAQFVTINDLVNRTVSLAAAITRNITQTVTIGESIGRLAIKTRALATQTSNIADNIAKITGTVRAIPVQTVTISSGTLARSTQKIRSFLEIINLLQIIQVFKNGLELIPPQPSNVGGSGKSRLYPKGPRLKQIRYPVYTFDQIQRIERRRRLRLKEPVIIPAFQQNIHKTVAPFVIVSGPSRKTRIRNTINGRFIASVKAQSSHHITFVGKPIPVQLPMIITKRIANKAKCPVTMQQKTIYNYGARLNKVAKLLKLLLLAENNPL